MKIGVLLSGSGVYDGSEIQESVFSLLAIADNGGEALCMAPNVSQMHVINHLSGEEMPETRNVLVESARIARGDIDDLENITSKDFDALVIPGGFGTAKNHTTWAINGPEGEIHPEVKRIVLEAVKNKKPIAALCMGPTTVAKALQGSGFSSELTVGSDTEKSPYDISSISNGIEATGSLPKMCSVKEVWVDHNLKIVSAPCYMMEASILEVKKNIDDAIKKMFQLVNQG